MKFSEHESDNPFRGRKVVTYSCQFRNLLWYSFNHICFCVRLLAPADVDSLLDCFSSKMVKFVALAAEGSIVFVGFIGVALESEIDVPVVSKKMGRFRPDSELLAFHIAIVLKVVDLEVGFGVAAHTHPCPIRRFLEDLVANVEVLKE